VESVPENPTEAQSEMLNALYTLSVLLDPSTRHFYGHQINQTTLAVEKFEEGFLEHAKLLPDDSPLLRRSLAFLHDYHRPLASFLIFPFRPGSTTDETSLHEGETIGPLLVEFPQRKPHPQLDDWQLTAESSNHHQSGKSYFSSPEHEGHLELWNLCEDLSSIWGKLRHDPSEAPSVTAYPKSEVDICDPKPKQQAVAWKRTEAFGRLKGPALLLAPSDGPIQPPPTYFLPEGSEVTGFSSHSLGSPSSGTQLSANDLTELQKHFLSCIEPTNDWCQDLHFELEPQTGSSIDSSDTDTDGAASSPGKRQE
jgi:hypothetical protein